MVAKYILIRKVVDFIIESNTIKGVVLQNKDKVLAKNTILATGHSARDIFRLLNKKSIEVKINLLLSV